MIDGLWTVEFISTVNRSGKGILVLNNGRLLGGDEGYYYSGTYHVADAKIQGTVDVVRFDPNTLSVFGDIDHFTLSFSGDINDYHLSAAATITDKPEFQIKVVANKKEDM
jgi:uncharacterized ubiquitin-like protein YukD